MINPPRPDFDDTRAGFRSGEGTESVMRHLMASARRLQRRRNETPDSRLAPSDSQGDGSVDIQLPLQAPRR
jgi:hypothetical protein